FSLKFIDPSSGYAGVSFQDGEEERLFVGLTWNEKFLQVSRPNQEVRYIPIQLDNEIAHDLKIRVAEYTLTVWVDDQQVTEIERLNESDFKVLFQSWDAKVEFDNVLITELDEESMSDAGFRNLINNSGFEYSTVSPNLPEYWGISAWGLADNEWIGSMDELWSRWRRDSENPYEGNFCMRVDGLNILGSTYFNLEPDRVYTFSAYLRSSEENTKVKVRFTEYQGVNISREFTVGKQWERVTWTLPALKDSRMGVIFTNESKGVLWVDAVQLNPGSTAKAYQRDNYVPGKEQHPDRPEITAKKSDEEIVLDGKLDESVWEDAAKMDFKTTANTVPKEKTECRILYDEENIYLGFRVYDSDMAGVRAAAEKHDSTVWSDDSVEIFVGPSGPRNDWDDYFHLALSITGARYDARKMDPSWNPDWQAKTARFPDHWEAEIVLPLKMFELTEFTLGDWTFNVARENRKIGEQSAWSPTYSSFHRPRYFGVLKALPREITEAYVSKQFSSQDGTQDFVVHPLVVDGKNFFGYGVSWESMTDPGENLFKILREQGMNLLIYKPYESAENKEGIHKAFQYAEQYGIKIAAWLTPGPLGEGKAPERVRKQVAEYKKYPAIIAWMAVDEPHANPEEVKACLQAAKDEDPSHPVFFNVTPHGLGMRIADLQGDLLAMDSYNFNFDASTIADLRPRFRQFQKEIRNRPGWAFLQGMGHALWVWKGPSPEEMTAQTYMALIYGISGIAYFNAVILPSNTWKQTAELAKEIRLLEPILTSPKNGQITSSNPKIDYCVKEYEGNTYLIAVNSTSSEMDATMVSKNPVSGAKDFFTSENIPINKNNMLLRFAPYERKVVELKQSHIVANP
ncbi:MAG: sugar-binding protein, partial [Chthoniobacterales bacterium]